MDNNHIINFQNFKKPDKDFIIDKECLICLESFDLESQQFVQLPCECSNSVYHITCITHLLKSGQNKNFCPHCKRKYTIISQPIVSPIALVPPVNDNGRIRMFVTILYVHILSNSIMNVINISESREYPQEDANIVSKLLLICYFCKLLVNICIVCKIRANTEKITSYLRLSYTIQTLLFILFICLMSSVKKDYNSILLIINNIFFYFGDFVFRIALEYKTTNIVQIQ
jgi:hypothetical protein